VTDADAVAALAHGDPARLAVLVDFDGSLSPIVDEPDDAIALPAARDALQRVARPAGLVAVVSGRPVAFLRERLALDGVRYVGQYGLEWTTDDGAVAYDMRAEPYLGAVARAADDAERAFPGVLVERKGRLAVGVHWRTTPEAGDAIERWSATAANDLGLAVHESRMARELRPPVPVDKGTAVGALLDAHPNVERACFAGDDRGDLAAFDALRDHRDAGRLGTAVRIAVRSDEAPPELLARGDVVVDGPAGLAALLDELARALS
jgi:trehalose 6-phosphate phosphatase